MKGRVLSYDVNINISAYNIMSSLLLQHFYFYFILLVPPTEYIVYIKH